MLLMLKMHLRLDRKILNSIWGEKVYSNLTTPIHISTHMHEIHTVITTLKVHIAWDLDERSIHEMFDQPNASMSETSFK